MKLKENNHWIYIYNQLTLGITQLMMAATDD